MKKATSLFLCLCIILSLSACSGNLTDKTDIISLFQSNEAAFLQAAESGDFTNLEQIHGVQKVYVLETCVDIQCGGAGMGSSTHYYGIFYSSEDDLCAIDVAGPENELVVHEDGFLYQEDGGDNRYYVEPLGNHYFYYEAHF